MFKKLCSALSLIFILCPTSSKACFALPYTARSSVEELVQRSPRIDWVEAISRDKSGKMKFKVIETLKGTKQSEILFESALSLKEEFNDYKEHSATAFWSETGGRGEVRPSCDVTASFSIGRRYLLFSGKPQHLKSFELVESPDDAWLKKVRELVVASLNSSAIVDLLDIIMEPQKYDGKVIITKGRLDLEFEFQSLSAISCGPAKESKSVWINTKNLNLIKLGSPNHVDVTVTGTFSAKEKGHLGMFEGTITAEALKVAKKEDKNFGCK